MYELQDPLGISDAYALLSVVSFSIRGSGEVLLDCCLEYVVVS